MLSEDATKWIEKYGADIFEKLFGLIDKDKKIGCWKWTGVMDRSGYPEVSGTTNGKRWEARAHLVVWRLFRGDVPDGKTISPGECHDISCVNPDHRILVDGPFIAAALRAQRKPTRETVIARFMANVTKVESGCWLWPAQKARPDGYGSFYYDGKTRGAHVASQLIFNGPIPPGFDVLHSCDTRLCVNPEHLRPGTHAENMLDMRERARTMRGELNGAAKLTDELVAQMRGEYRGGDGEVQRLSDKYGVSLSVVSAILAGKTWKHVEVPLGSVPSDDPARASLRLRGEQKANASLTNEQVVIIKTAQLCLKNSGNGPRGFWTAVAKRFDVTPVGVSAVVTGRLWKSVKVPADVAELASYKSNDPKDFDELINYATALVVDAKFRAQVGADKCRSEDRHEEAERLELTALLN